MEWFLTPIKEKFAEFTGRARRREFWMFNLFAFIISMILSAIDAVIGTQYYTMGIMSLVFSLVILIPSLALTVRRLHDVNKSGWFILISFIPLIGTIWLLVLLCKEGDQGPNQYGADPKNPSNELDEIGVAQ